MKSVTSDFKLRKVTMVGIKLYANEYTELLLNEEDHVQNVDDEDEQKQFRLVSCCNNIYAQTNRMEMTTVQGTARRWTL